MVALSDLESNIFDKVSKWKRCAVLTDGNSSPTKKNESVVVSEFGDLKVTQIRQPQKHLNETEITHAITEYQGGMTTYQLAEKYGCTRQAISNALKAHGVVVTKSKAAKKIDDKTIIKMYASMLTAEQIAEKYGVYPQLILKCLRENGITIRGRWDYKK